MQDSLPNASRPSLWKPSVSSDIPSGMDPKQILAIKLRELGDTVLWTPSLRALRSRFPNAKIDVLVLRGGAELLQENPWTDEILTVSDRGLPTLAQTFWSLRSRRYDLLLGFHATSGVLKAAWLSGAKSKILHHYSRAETPRGSLPVAKPDELTDSLSRDFKVLKALGWDRAPERPELFLSPQEKAWGARQVKGSGSLAVLPGSRVETHRYPLDLWKETLDQLLARGLPLVVLADSALSQAWDLKTVCEERKIRLFDQLTLRQFLALLVQCKLALGNDSGPIHMASALGLKTITLFGPGCAGDYHPYNLMDHPFLRVEIECRDQGPQDGSLFSYCTKETCSHMSCLRALTPKLVSDKVRELSGETLG